ncbi:MAG: thioredoxin domain-containing protein [Desulfobacterales bacterium]|nr:thioredoxin domain-containing protein [Desulfobacterales bacterium]
MPNRLAHEKSPYLLQHAHNPVDWHPWSDEAFARAVAENKPIFLSIGYATCHWCHVMERESFEDEEAARVLNATFVCIKVDREERPDIDAVYMAACQMMTGGGGWPLTIFMTPERRPFFAATYLPRRTRFGRQGLIELCERVRELWALEPQRVNASAAGIAENLGRAFAYAPAEAPGLRLLDRAYDDIAFGFDGRHGGFEPAPKFPTPHRLLFLLRVHDRTGDPRALEMVERTLAAMRLGGIWDHVGHGIHRYSTDARWRVPHFEKMLYDQALTALAALAARQVSGKAEFARTAEEIFAYVLRDMTSDEGGFYSAEDADSEGEEGRFYVWTRDEFHRVLGPEEAAFWEPVFNVTAEGNYREEASGRPTGANILHLDRPLSAWARELGNAESELEERWEAARARLFAARKTRVHPLKDDKVLADWNGLMIAALAEGARVLRNPDYAADAERAARFVLAQMRGADGRLFHRFRLGERVVHGQATDYAFMIHGLLHLYRATFQVEWAEEAATLQRVMVAELWDEAAGGFFLSAGTDGRDLPVRPKDLADGAIPSANSVALTNLLWLSRLTGDTEWAERAQATVRAFAGTVERQPAAFVHFLCGLDFALRPGQDVVLAGEEASPDALRLIEALNGGFAPNRVTLFKSGENAARLARLAGYTDGLDVVRGGAAAHLCVGASCKESVTNVDDLIARIAGKTHDRS